MMFYEYPPKGGQQNESEAFFDNMSVMSDEPKNINQGNNNADNIVENVGSINDNEEQEIEFENPNFINPMNEGENDDGGNNGDNGDELDGIEFVPAGENEQINAGVGQGFGFEDNEPEEEQEEENLADSFENIDKNELNNNMRANIHEAAFYDKSFKEAQKHFAKVEKDFVKNERAFEKSFKSITDKGRRDFAIYQHIEQLTNLYQQGEIPEKCFVERAHQVYTQNFGKIPPVFEATKFPSLDQYVKDNNLGNLSKDAQQRAYEIAEFKANNEKLETLNDWVAKANNIEVPEKDPSSLLENKILVNDEKPLSKEVVDSYEVIESIDDSKLTRDTIEQASYYTEELKNAEKYYEGVEKNFIKQEKEFEERYKAIKDPAEKTQAKTFHLAELSQQYEDGDLPEKCFVERAKQIHTDKLGTIPPLFEATNFPSQKQFVKDNSFENYSDRVQTVKYNAAKSQANDAKQQMFNDWIAKSHGIEVPEKHSLDLKDRIYDSDSTITRDNIEQASYYKDSLKEAQKHFDDVSKNYIKDEQEYEKNYQACKTDEERTKLKDEHIASLTKMYRQNDMPQRCLVDRVRQVREDQFGKIAPLFEADNFPSSRQFAKDKKIGNLSRAERNKQYNDALGKAKDEKQNLINDWIAYGNDLEGLPEKDPDAVLIEAGLIPDPEAEKKAETETSKEKDTAEKQEFKLPEEMKISIDGEERTAKLHEIKPGTPEEQRKELSEYFKSVMQSKPDDKTISDMVEKSLNIPIDEKTKAGAVAFEDGDSYIVTIAGDVYTRDENGNITGIDQEKLQKLVNESIKNLENEKRQEKEKKPEEKDNELENKEQNPEEKEQNPEEKEQNPEEKEQKPEEKEQELENKEQNPEEKEHEGQNKEEFTEEYFDDLFGKDEPEKTNEIQQNNSDFEIDGEKLQNSDFDFVIDPNQPQIIGPEQSNDFVIGSQPINNNNIEEPDKNEVDISNINPNEVDKIKDLNQNMLVHLMDRDVNKDFPKVELNQNIEPSLELGKNLEYSQKI